MLSKYYRANYLGLHKSLNTYAFLMAFPIFLVVGQNISLLIFISFVFKYGKKLGLLSIQYYPQLIAIAFGIGAIISVLDLDAKEPDGTTRALAVLPNYLYWALLIIVLININRYISANWLSRFLFFGLICSVGYYYIQGYLPRIPLFINRSSPNSFSFLLICFSAPAAVYVFNRTNNKIFAIIFVLVLSGVLATEGRRAGFVLVSISSILALIISRITTVRLTSLLILVLGLNIALQTEVVEASIASLNPRIYGLIYENETIETEDRSYLVRRLMVEKAGIIFSKNPLTGIGLNNFTNYEVIFKGEFVGSEFVADKITMNEKSAHNSYLALLAEGGLLVFLPFLILIISNLYYFVRYYQRRSQIENAFYWSFVAMVIHLYLISAILNVYAWFLIGIVSALSMKYRILSTKTTS